jgi:hypothetical protein
MMVVVVVKKIKCSTLDTRELLNANRSSALSQEVQKLFLEQETNLQNRIFFFSLQPSARNAVEVICCEKF